MATGQERLISFVVSMGGVILGATLGYSMNVSPDFTVFIDDMIETVPANTDYELVRTINIDDARIFKHYKYPIMLEANLLNGTALPEGIKVDFMPAGSPEVPFTSTMKISISNMPECRFKLKIVAFGGDGKERNFPFFLDIKDF
jgi:hypothetical protein